MISTNTRKINAPQKNHMYTCFLNLEMYVSEHPIKQLVHGWETASNNSLILSPLGISYSHVLPRAGS